MVLFVNNLDDSGAESLRDALTSSSYKGKKRTIVFKVSGTIELLSDIEIKYDSCITIAGQTAPGDGICIKNFPIKVGDSHDLIFRYLRFRIGDEQDCGTGCDDIDALSFRKSYHIIVDHCSLSWSIDDVLDLTVTTGYSTIQWCILSEPMNNSKHSKGAHGYIAGWDGSSYGGGGIFGGGSYHHNLLASGGSRTPRLDSYADDNGKRDLIDIVNNVIYNWSGYGAYGGEHADVNWQNNYYKYGPSTSNRFQIFLPDDSCKMFLNGNYVDGYPTVTEDNSKGIRMESAALTLNEILQDKPYEVWSIEMQSAEDAYKSILPQAGALLPQRDAVDIRIVNDVIDRTGKIIDSPSQVGGWPALNNTVPPADSDLDGMPDTWEDARGLDKNNPGDRNNLTSNGYTQLENYLNSIEFQNPVQNVNYQMNSDGLASIHWDDLYIGEDSFRIERSVNGAPYTVIANLSKNSTLYVDNDFQPAQEINYRIIAIQVGVVETPPNEIITATGLDLQISDSIYVGDTIDIIPLFEPKNVTNQLIGWNLSQNPENISELDYTGRLVALHSGEVIITGTLMDGSNTEATKKVVILEKIPSTDHKNILDQKEPVGIYPNPSADGYFYLSVIPELSGGVQIRVTDITGKEIYNIYTETKGQLLLNHHFASGIYLIDILTENHHVVHQLMVNQ